eukprot:scaffold89015_cov42-Phaeocystis_antarctica.AAC.1
MVGGAGRGEHAVGAALEPTSQHLVARVRRERLGQHVVKSKLHASGLVRVRRDGHDRRRYEILRAAMLLVP